MLTTNSMRLFLKSISQQTNFSPAEYLESLAVYLKVHITLVDNSGCILFQSKLKLPNLQKHVQRIPILHAGQTWGAMLVDKETPTELEQALLEMFATLISLHLS